MQESLLTRLQRFDAARPSFPGEHLFTLAAGVWLLARGNSLLGRATGLALVARAVTGRDGLLKGPLPALGWNGRTGDAMTAPAEPRATTAARAANASPEVQATAPLAL